MPECRWCFKKATAWIRDVGQVTYRYPEDFPTQEPK